MNELDDTLNYAFRKLIFKKLRLQFFLLKSLNMKLLNKIDLKILNKISTDTFDRESFICSIEGNELAEVLLVNDEKKLDEISDHLSYNCIKSLTRLIKLLMSENLKVLHILKLNSSPLNNELVSHIKYCIKTLIEIFKCRVTINKVNSELKNLTKFISLVPDNNNITKKMVVKKMSNEHHLAIHLRHTLLNCMSLNDQMQSKKKEILHSLKSSFEYCGFYLKKLSNEIEGYEECIDEKEQIDIHKVLTLGKILLFSYSYSDNI